MFTFLHLSSSRAATPVFAFQVVLHLAAEWRPEVLRQSPEQARQLNVDAAGWERSNTTKLALEPLRSCLDWLGGQNVWLKHVETLIG